MTTNENENYLNVQPTHETGDETPAGRPERFVLVAQRVDYQVLVGVADTKAEADEFARLANKGRFEGFVQVIPAEHITLQIP